MDPKFQTSFIPQKPITSGSSLPGLSYSPANVSKTINIFNIIATVAFVLSVLVCGGVFIYKQILTSQIATESNNLTAAQNALDFTTIQNLVDISSRIGYTKQLLDKHVAISGLFNLLQSLTVQKVSFNSLTYNKKDDGTIEVTMPGEAKGYDALAVQSNIFAANSYIKDPVFSNFDLAQNGDVTFQFTATIDPSLVSYKEATAAISLPISQQASGAASSTQTQ